MKDTETSPELNLGWETQPESLAFSRAESVEKKPKAAPPSAPALEPDKAPPLVLPREGEERYVFESELNKGGMKVIIKVRDKATDRDVAMAVLSEKLSRKSGTSERFLQEARITSNLEHPNIVPIHDIGVNKDGSPFFTMKMLGGETLASIIRKLRNHEEAYCAKYTVSAMLTILMKVFDAVEFAHSRGIIHLDLKPENIQVGEYGEVLVLDWGLSRQVQREHQGPAYRNPAPMLQSVAYTLDGEVKGTIGYMAPEQAIGFNHRKDERTDIYALGAILYTMLCYHRPVKGRADVSAEFDRALEATYKGRIPAMREQNPDAVIPPALDAVVRYAMQIKPDERYESVGAFRADIQKYLNGFATYAEKASIGRQTYLFVRRHRFWLAAVLCMALIGLFVGLTLYRDRVRSQATWGTRSVLLPSKALRDAQWLVHEGQWDIASDRIQATGGADEPHRLRYAREISGNTALEFDAWCNDNVALERGGDLSAVLNFAPERNEDGYFFQLGAFNNSCAVIQRRNGFLCMVPFTVEPNRRYRIRIEKEQGVLRLFCDGKRLIEVNDIFYLDGGSLALYTFGGGKNFANIRLYERGIPELVTALTEGNGFFRQSRLCTDEKMRRVLLTAAASSYAAVRRDHMDDAVGDEALLHHAYVCLELGNYTDAERDLIALENRSENRGAMEHLLLAGEIRLRTRDYSGACDYFARALHLYPEHAVNITGLLMARLSQTDLLNAESSYRQRLWRLAAENLRVTTFRCRNKGLHTIDFIEKCRFTMVDLSGNPIRDLTPLANMPITYLDVSHTAIESLDALTACPLRELYVHACPNVSDLTPLSQMVQLRTLVLPARFAPRAKVLRAALPQLEKLEFRD